MTTTEPSEPKTDDERESAILELAREQRGQEGDIEFDDAALISEGDANGAYVQAWVWIDFAGTNLDKNGLIGPNRQRS